MNPNVHQNDLLSSGRCARCAERVSRTLIVREEACPHCDSPLEFHGGDVLEALSARRLRWRLIGYALVAVGSFVAGAVPLLQVVVQLVALFILHIVVLRRGLVWLSPGRRILARIGIKLWGAAIATTALLINVAIVPLVGVSAFILGFVGPVLTAAYVEGGLVILRKRLRLEANGEPLRTSEWALPLGVLAALLVAVAATIGIALGTLHLISTAEIPAISDISKEILELTE